MAHMIDQRCQVCGKTHSIYFEKMPAMFAEAYQWECPTKNKTITQGFDAVITVDEIPDGAIVAKLVSK